MAIDRLAADEPSTRGPVRVLSTGRIVFLVVAAAAPMAAMVGNTPLALALGNGPALPAAYLVAGLTLLCFAVAYAAMGRRVVNTGAFYTYVSHGLGRPPAVAAAYLAVVSYGALTIGLAGAFGYFTSLVTAALGVSTPWLAWAGVGVVVVGALGYRSVDLSSKVLGVLMGLEILVLVVLDLAVVGRHGAQALPLTSFAPSTVVAGGLSGGFGLVLMFAYTSFIGFESAALYGEEARDPTRSIPRATYVAVTLIGVFYLLTSWIVVGGIGVDRTAEVARRETGNLLFALATQYAGVAVSDVMGLLLCTSILASMLAIHNAATRYLFALGREHLLPTALGRLHPRRYAPSLASLVLTCLTGVVVVAFAVARLDPYLTLAPSLIGLSTLGIVALQAIAAIAVLGYFRRIHVQDGPWRTLVAPALAAVGLVIAVVLVSFNYAALTGTHNRLINALPAALVAIAVGGVLYGLWLRRSRPRVYAGLAQVQLRQSTERRARLVARYDGRYCVVGGGPAGLITARALRLEGIEYDQFERHTDVGGIWDIDNPGSPMYESAHFISSKYTSGFYGFPMPDSFPDYPDHRQLLGYIRDFTDAYGLRERITLGVSVECAEPVGTDAAGGWDVRLSTGEVRHYAGVVCATGVTWHPALPDYPGLDDFGGEVRHVVTYRDPGELRGRRVLVVGGGNSGVDIAGDAAQHAAAAYLSLRRGYRFVPKHMFGVPTDVFLGGQMQPPKGVVVPDDPSKLLDAIVGDLARFGLQPPDHDALQTHPIMNSQVLHYLAHGDLVAKRDVARFTRTGAVFADGSEEELDLVLFATGYDYRIPYLDPALLEWRNGRPQLYLNVLHRTLRGLSVIGAVEFASAAYQRFDEMAGLVVMDAHIEQTGDGLARWREMKAHDDPDLRGHMTYLDSPRHTNYVEVGTYQRVVAQTKAAFGWPDPGPATYDGKIVRSHGRLL
jgi:amino acid transporter